MKERSARFQTLTNTMKLRSPLSPVLSSCFPSVQRFLVAFAAVLCGTLGALPAHAQSVYEPYTFRTLAGLTGVPGDTDGTGSTARFASPTGIALDSAGTVYVADTNNNTIRKITSAGVVTTFAGLAGSPGSADGTGTAAQFVQPYDVAVDSAGTVYVADTFNHTIRKITPAGAVTTLAGLAGIFGSVDGTGSSARFQVPAALAVDSAGNVYVADIGNRLIRKITPGGVVSTLAGSSVIAGGADGTGSGAQFHSPQGVAADSVGNVYVADRYSIRKITPAGVVSTLAGLNGNSGSADGTGSAALFFDPTGVAVDSAGNVYVADTGNQLIRKITPAGVVTTLAGLAGISGSADGTGSAAPFRFPQRIAVDNGGGVYVADTQNQTIRVGVPPSGNRVIVPGTANPFLAGLPAGSTAKGGDTAPAQSPVLVPLTDISGGNQITFFGYRLNFYRRSAFDHRHAGWSLLFLQWTRKRHLGLQLPTQRAGRCFSG